MFWIVLLSLFFDIPDIVFSSIVYYRWVNDSFVELETPLNRKAASLQSGFFNPDTSVIPNKIDYYSQVGQDKLIIELLGGKKSGFYVDLAANHYCQLSNTYTLEKYYFWNGLCIEPNPDYWKTLLEFRRCKVISSPVSSKNNEVILFRADGCNGGIVSKDMDNKPNIAPPEKKVDYDEFSLQTVTVDVILNKFNAPKVMDYLSLDVEGAEYVVLLGFDFSNYVFTIITVERPTIQIHRLLSKNHYWWLTRLASFGECLYVHRSIQNFNKILPSFNASRNIEWGNKDGSNPQNHTYMLHPKWTGEYINI